MPNLEEHCRHCLERFGVEGREIHKWIDEPSRYYGRAHREIRHDLETADYIAEKFGVYCGEGAKGQYLAKLCYFDHVFLDIDASKNNAPDAPSFTQEEIKALEQKRPILEEEVGKIQKQIKQLDELPPLTIREMVEYISIKLGGKSPELRFLAEVSLRHWQKFLFSRDMHNREVTEIDVNSFISRLNQTVKSPYTRAGYLGQLVAYFQYAYIHDKNLAIKLKEAKKNANKEVDEMKKNALPLRIDTVRRFLSGSKPFFEGGNKAAYVQARY